MTALYNDWGYAPQRANLYAALSAWSIQAAMEVMDAPKKTQGFSWKDMVMTAKVLEYWQPPGTVAKSSHYLQ